MKTRISRISVLQTSKVVAAVYGVFGLVYIPFGFAVDSGAPAGGQLGVAWLFTPLLLAGMMFVVTALFTWLYNVVAGQVGGIEFELTHDDGA